MPKGTKIRGIRIDDDLWNAVQERAAADGRRVSEVIRELLREFVK